MSIVFETSSIPDSLSDSLTVSKAWSVLLRTGLTMKIPTAAIAPTITASLIIPLVTFPKRLRRSSIAVYGDYPPTRGQGHREADPPALVDLVPDGPGKARVG